MRTGVLFLAAMIALTSLSFAEPADSKSDMLSHGTVTATNSIYDIFVQDIPGGGVGQYTVRTGPAHPVTVSSGSPQNVLYGGQSGLPGTSFNTIRSYTTGTDYYQGVSVPTSAFTTISLDPVMTPGISTTVTPLGTTGYRTVYTLPGPPVTPDSMTIMQDININGTTFNNSSVEVTTTVTPWVTATEIGIRYLWDFEIGNDDGPPFAERDPDVAPTIYEADFAPPGFSYYRIEDNDINIPVPFFDVFGTTNGPGAVTPPPTPPDLVQQAAWPLSFYTAFNYTTNPLLDVATTSAPYRGFAGGDNAVHYFWGPDPASAITILPGHSVTVSQSIFAAPPGEEPFSCPRFVIQKAHALSGQTVVVSITLEDNPVEMGGFDFLIAYDGSALAFRDAQAGQLLEDCGWEYFTYRYGVEGNCGDACPSGLLRIIALADLDNGSANHPSCYGPPDSDPHELVEMRFQVSPDRNLIGQCVPIRWFWDDCGDNAVSSIDGNIVYLDSRIFSAEDVLLWDEDDDDEYPEDARPPGLGAPDECLEGAGPDKPLPERRDCFRYGGICIDEPPDDRGDINLNDIANEVGDAVLFSNYFIYGNSVWDPVYQDAQILATDVNDDGIVLTIADLVYLIRVITGDEQAFPPGENPRLSPYQAHASVDCRVDNGCLTVDWVSDVDAGAVLLAFDHEGARLGEPVLSESVSGMRMISHDNGSQLRVLIVGMAQGVRIPSGQQTILTVPVPRGENHVRLAEADAADYWGVPIDVHAARVAGVPRESALAQNVPNPFNASTQITFDLTEPGNVSLVVYDVVGEKVATLLGGHMEAGTHHVIWDARDDGGGELASGVYFYRLVTPTTQATRKMVLLK
jgi:hypothetical protein